MMLSLPKEKLEKINNQCKIILEMSLIMVRELGVLIGWLLTTGIVVHLDPLQYRVSPANSKDDLELFSRRENESIKTSNGGTTLMDLKPQSVQ